MSVTFYRQNSNPDQELNVSNTNFCAIMELLDSPIGGPEGLCGSFSGASLLFFQGKINFVLNSLEAMPALDEGKPTEVLAPNFIDCGRSDGYFTNRLRTLKAIVDATLEANDTLYFA